MLISLAQEQLNSIAPFSSDGAITVDREELFKVLDEAFGVSLTGLAISSVDYSQHTDGTPEPDTRTLKGIAWISLGGNLCNKWSFRTDGRALSTTDEGNHRCPVSEDPDLIARATIAICDQYSESGIDERNARLTLTLPNGEIRKARVVVTHDPRVLRVDDILENELELTAYNAGTLGVVIVQPRDDGQALVRKFGLD